jgi:hypothetical protein
MDFAVVSASIFFMAVGMLDLFIAHQALFKHRLYWLFPSITGFKTRKRDLSSRGESYFFGIGALLGAILCFFFAFRCLSHAG